MNEIVNTFLLADDRFMPEVHSKQPGFTNSVCGTITKNKKRIQKLKEAGIQNIFRKMNYIKAVFNMIWLMQILKI